MFKNKSETFVPISNIHTRKSGNKLLLRSAIVLLIIVFMMLIGLQWHPVESDHYDTQMENQIMPMPSGQSNEDSGNKKGFFATLFNRNKPAPPKQAINQAFLRNVLSDHIQSGEFPTQLTVNQTQVTIDYTIDQSLQDWAEKRLGRYNPDYGVFVALEPDSGKILALATNRRDEQQSADLALRATYPAASTFKVITAAATLEEGVAKPDTMFDFNGKSTSLYKSQVFNIKQNKWTRRMSLKTAFAKSVNPIFGRLGAKKLGAETLMDYAQRFGYNAKFVSDFEFDNGSIQIETDNEWQAAESATGYTRRNTLSPVHGAVIAATIANGGKLISPNIVQQVTGANNQVLYSSDEPRSISILSGQSVQAMQKLMAATISHGTARKSFGRFAAQHKGITLGGKSGHLSGNSPKGTYDWFIGYAKLDERKIAYAMLCINKEKWYVKSARFAREAMEFYFSSDNTKIAKKPSSSTFSKNPS